MEQIITYQKAPLVELIVELHWPVQAVGHAGGPPIIFGQDAVFDRWFQGLTSRLSTLGFHDLERLVPHSMPAMAYQPLFRYRRGSDAFPVVQFGHGIFTVNAGPPTYQSWRTFRPQVEQAVSALVQTRPSESSAMTFSRVALRYIDLFGEELRADRSNYAFIRDDLGITLGLPAGLIELATDPDRISPTIALNVPIDDRDNASLTFQVAAARLGNRQTTDTVMDMTYAIAGTVPMVESEVLERLQAAYTVIHGWFDTLIARFRERLEPTPEA
jgi:uncharacterized protein (TIGR04255 family)